MNKLPVRKEFEYQPVGSWGDGNPFTIAFVYPKNEKAFAVKGGLNDVKRYIKGLHIPCIVHYPFFRNESVRFTSIEVYGLKPEFRVFVESSRWPIDKQFMSYGKPVFQKKVRHLPRGWMKELDPFVA